MIFYVEKFQSNMNTLTELHQTATGVYQKTLDNWNKIIFIISKSLLVMYIGSVLIFAMVPLAFYVIEGQMKLAIEIVLPFLDPETNRGFYINLAYQLYSLVFACAGISSIDWMFVFYSFQGLALVQATRMSFKEFGNRLETTDRDSLDPLGTHNQVPGPQLYLFWVELVLNLGRSRVDRAELGLKFFFFFLLKKFKFQSKKLHFGLKLGRKMHFGLNLGWKKYMIYDIFRIQIDFYVFFFFNFFFGLKNTIQISIEKITFWVEIGFKLGYCVWVENGSEKIWQFGLKKIHFLIGIGMKQLKIVWVGGKDWVEKKNHFQLLYR